MDLFYTWVSGNTYKITLIAYANCGSAGAGSAYDALSTNTPAVYIYNGSTYINTIRLAIQAPITGVEITPVCPADLLLTQCTNTSYTIPGIKKFVYTANYTLPATSTVWRFLFTGDMTGTGTYFAGRATSITNISSGTYVELVDTLNNSTVHNTSPLLSVVPTPFFCLDNSDNYNPGALDPDGDSLSFALVSGIAGTATSAAGGPVSYTTGFSATAPLAATTFTFDTRTGQISFYPNALQRSLVVYNVREYRGGVFVGSSQREMTFLVLTCTTSLPGAGMSTATGGTITDSTHFQICANSGPFSFHISPTGPDTSVYVTMTSAGLPTGSTFNVTGNGTHTPVGTFSWNSTGLAPGSYTFYVTFRDNNCPLSGIQTLAYTVTIMAAPNISYSLITGATCLRKAAVSIIPSGLGAPWKVKVVDAFGDTLSTFTGITAPFTDSLTPGTYTLVVWPTLPSTCKAFVTFTISAPAPPTPSITFTNPSYCGINDGSITISGLTPGTSDTIKYTYNGVVQTPVVRTVAAGGTIGLTGLPGGLYTGFTVTYGYCVSASLGPFNLTPPPFTMRALISTNPDYCGVCNGTIKLFGLHPGQLDTIYYSFGGVAQPPVIRTIPADSTVTITGLCAGVYSNIYAVTAGICTSNILGPVNLTAPPFTMRAISFTNPVYCGVCNGTITLYGIHPGITDTITYTLGGVAQPPVVRVIASDSTATLTGLCAGTYANFQSHTGGSCISNLLGPVTLTTPPFTMRAISFTNPDYCGDCNGTITLYGLYPGETDSILYTLGGVAQPPVVRTVGSDSQIVITGLCQGIYANFVARTGGNCISNTLGPVTLTVPPFTVRGLSFTNPDYCGICNGTITLYGLHPGQHDTVSFTKDGVAQPVFTHLIGSDSTIVITGLCAGLYDNITVRTGGVCVSNTLGPANLTVPPFTMRAISFTNPTKCGFCDGSVILYGLHPGQTDTISFNFNGVAQPVVSGVIGSDSTLTITGLCEGTYTGFVARTGGVCVSNTLGPVRLVAPPIIPGFTFNLIKSCAADTLVVTNTSSPASDLTYFWDFGDGGTSAATNPVHIYYLPGVYNIKLIITNTKCFDSLTQSVNVDNLIHAGFNAVPDSFLCQGKPVTFTNTSSGTALLFTWIYGDGVLDHTLNTVHVFTNSGVYNVKLAVTNYVPCHDTASMVLSVDSISAISMKLTDSVFCRGNSATFTANYSLFGNKGILWTFGDGENASNINPVTHSFDMTGVLTVTAEALYRACPDTSVSRKVYVFGNPGVDLGGDTSICPGSEPLVIVERANENNRIARFVWNTGQTGPRLIVTAPGIYYVTVNIQGCTTTDSIRVKNDCYMDIPNAFTPNGDGLNDYFFPRQQLSSGLVTFSMQIYNRWGQEIFATTNIDGRGWDGKFNGVDQPEGVFVYIIEGTFRDGQKESHKGNVTLVR